LHRQVIANPVVKLAHQQCLAPLLRLEPLLVPVRLGQQALSLLLG
jgi:hypothetical protein